MSATPIEHRPEDLTCTTPCDITLEALQHTLAAARQWLPVDPPHPGRRTVGKVISENLTGPHRLGFGTLRDYLIGLDIDLADGTRIRSGGQVVKNVAGYDLHKLFIGSRGSLGTPVRATFRLLPLPAARHAAGLTAPTVVEAFRFAAEAFRRVPLLVALDVCRPGAADLACHVHARCAGTEPDVQDQSRRLAELGFLPIDPIRWDEQLWPDPSQPPTRSTVLPSHLPSATLDLGDRPFVARAGNGILLHSGPPVRRRREPPRFLLDRLKAAFDPEGHLPPLPE
ncbi:MAG: FAD-binding oxidoreductase [Verrucomicrobiae bacterium]|nr:FAD-binding oxidoreductase [Verrucomicrobiae bacterium]